jgi:hypothetical protein
MYLRDSKFIISCAARTGSTFLVHLLRSNPKILCHGEVISLDKVGNLTGTYGKKRREIPDYAEALHHEFINEPERFIYSSIFDSQGHRTTGFKYKTDESLSPEYGAYTDIIADDKDIKVIHLKRRNLLDQYISHQVVLKQSGVTLLLGNERPEIEPFECDIGHVTKYFKDVVRREKASAELYEAHRFFNVNYEDLVADINTAHSRRDIQRFLEVKVVPLTSHTKKIISDSNTLVTNIDEVLEHFSNTAFSDRIF